MKLKYDSMFAPFCVYCKIVINAHILVWYKHYKEILLTYMNIFMRYLLSYIACICST